MRRNKIGQHETMHQRPVSGLVGVVICCSCCKPAVVVNHHSQLDLIFSQATLPKHVGTLAATIMDRYEKCELGDQRRNLDSLMNKPEFKQNYLSPIRSLDEEEQCRLLELVLQGDISILELKAAGAKSKKMTKLKELFVKLTNCKKWEDCEALYPHHATTERLEDFLHIDLKKVPPSFKLFCSKAKSSVGMPSVVNNDHPPVQFRGEKCHIIVASNQMALFDLKHQYDPAFQGASLTIMKLNNVSYILIQ